MHCPRCGTPNEPGDRYCSSCGATLTTGKDGDREPKPTAERLRDLVGTTRTARLATIGTILAIVVAVIAFLALDSDEETIPRDGYTVAADEICLQAKRQIVAAERRAASQGQAVDGLATDLVPIIVNWRARFRDLTIPPDRLEQAEQLNVALLGAMAKIGGLARAENGGAAARRAKEADLASAGVEEAIVGLGLSQCAAAEIGFTPSPS